LCYFVSQTTKGVVISETKAQLIIKQILSAMLNIKKGFINTTKKEEKL